jgi:hypothetical protein
MSRQDDFLKIVGMFNGSGGMQKTAQGDPMAAMAGMAPPMQVAPMDPAMMMPPPPEAMVPPPPPPPPAGKNENDVALKAMDLAAKTIEYALADEEKEPEQMTDEAAAILAGSKALDSIPAEEIANESEGQLPPEEEGQQIL